MPTYEYECTHCGYRFEASQKITAKPLTKCPKCEKKVKRLISRGLGFIFKGSGFYATDYRKHDKPKADTAKVSEANTCPKAKEGCNACVNK
ncbi:MAG: FmdB family zinc ribbon protein [Candidatus Omnitrophota bacterium]